MIKLKKLVSCAVMAAAVSLGASIVNAMSVGVPSTGTGSWDMTISPLIDFGGGDQQLSVSLGSSTPLNFVAQNCCNPGSEFILILDGSPTAWTSSDNLGTLGGTGLFEGLWTGAGSHTFSLFVSVDSGLGGGGMQWSAFSPTAPIPEPEIYAMMAAGLGMLGFLGRRRKGRGSAAA